MAEEGSDGNAGVPWYRRRRTVALAVGIIVLGAAVAALSLSFDARDLLHAVEVMRRIGRHWWAPAALVAAMIVVNLFDLPGTPLTIASGAVWGWLGGTAWMMVATMIGTAVPYLIARRGFRSLSRRFCDRYPKTVEWIRGSGFTAVAVLRLVPAFPFALTSYGAGVARVSARDYVAGTFAGTLPGILVWAYSADSILRGLASPAEASRRILFTTLLLASFMVTTALIARRVRNRSSR